MFEAATFGDLDRLTELLAEDPELVDAISGDGFTPLHLAAFFGQSDAAGSCWHGARRSIAAARDG